MLLSVVRKASRFSAFKRLMISLPLTLGSKMSNPSHPLLSNDCWDTGNPHKLTFFVVGVVALFLQTVEQSLWDVLHFEDEAVCVVVELRRHPVQTWTGCLRIIGSHDVSLEVVKAWGQRGKESEKATLAPLILSVQSS